MFPPTCAALNGSDGGGCAWRGVRPSLAQCDNAFFLLLRAALLYGTDVAVAPHSEAARHGQVQSIHRLRLHLAKDRLTDCLYLPVHLHLTHLQKK